MNVRDPYGNVSSALGRIAQRSIESPFDPVSLSSGGVAVLFHPPLHSTTAMKMNLSQSAWLRSLAAAAALGCYSVAILGCSGNATPDSSTASGTADHDDHDHDDHDHDADDHDGHDHDHDGHDHDGHDHGDDHAGHDHPAHGPHGGHMVELSGGKHAEWVHNDQKDEILVYVESPDTVEKVEMTVTIEDETTAYEFEPVEGESYYRIVSPDLLFAVKMGESVQTKLVITNDEGEISGAVKHHAH